MGDADFGAGHGSVACTRRVAAIAARNGKVVMDSGAPNRAPRKLSVMARWLGRGRQARTCRQDDIELGDADDQANPA